MTNLAEPSIVSRFAYFLYPTLISLVLILGWAFSDSQNLKELEARRGLSAASQPTTEPYQQP